MTKTVFIMFLHRVDLCENFELPRSLLNFFLLLFKNTSDQRIKPKNPEKSTICTSQRPPPSLDIGLQEHP